MKIVLENDGSYSRGQTKKNKQDKPAKGPRSSRSLIKKRPVSREPVPEDTAEVAGDAGAVETPAPAEVETPVVPTVVTPAESVPAENPNPADLWAEADAINEAKHQAEMAALQEEQESPPAGTVGGMPYVEDTFEEDEEIDAPTPDGSAVSGGDDAVPTDGDSGYTYGTTAGVADSNGGDDGGSSDTAVDSSEQAEVIDSTAVEDEDAAIKAKPARKGISLQAKKRIRPAADENVEDAVDAKGKQAPMKKSKAAKKEKPVKEAKRAEKPKKGKHLTKAKEAPVPTEVMDMEMPGESTGLSPAVSTALTVLVALVLGAAGLFGGFQYAGIYLEQLVTKALGG